MKTIKGIGKFKLINQINSGTGKIIAGELFEHILYGFAKQSAKYIKVTSEAPYAFRERQLHSLFVPAFLGITDAFLMENPIERSWKVKEEKNTKYKYTGWMDYWCRHRSVDFFIELKHSYCSYRTGIITEITNDRWKYVNNDQLPKLKDEAKVYGKLSKGVILASLHVVTVYEIVSLKKLNIKSFEEEKLMQIQQDYFDSLMPSPNWSGLWIPNNNLLKTSRYEFDSKHEYYPAVMFFSKINEII
jgi:hypothetical protein